MRGLMVTRRHHYLPRFYLSGFTSTGKDTGRLHVFDMEGMSLRESIPSAEAWQKDYHRIDMPGVDADLYEKTLCQFEGDAAKAILDVTTDLTYSGDQLEMILSFVTLSAVRVPWSRQRAREALELRTGRPFNDVVTSQESWAKLEQWSISSIGPCKKWDTERLAKDPVYHKAAVQAWNHHLMFRNQEDLFQMLAERSWSMLVPSFSS